MAKVALFSLEDRGYALAVDLIEQIIELEKIFDLPQTPRQFCGALLFRQEVIPVVDLWSAFGINDANNSTRALFAAICTSRRGAVALPARQVLRIVDMAKGTLQFGDDGSGDEEQKYFLWAGKRYPLLTIDAILTRPFR